MGVDGKRTRYLYASLWKWKLTELMWVIPVNNRKSRCESFYCDLMKDGRKCRARLFPHTYRLLLLLYVLSHLSAYSNGPFRHVLALAKRQNRRPLRRGWWSRCRVNHVGFSSAS